MSETQEGSPCSHPVPADDNRVDMSSCRSCSDRFTYTDPSGATVNIIAGIPAPGLKYKAISHVWGPPNTINMVCQSCSTVHKIRMRSRSTFSNIMALAGPGSTVWMDNMSINQSDQADVAAQVAVMGEIFGQAECVSVLLPESDKDAYETIAELLHMAGTLLSRKRLFDYTKSDSYWDSPQLQAEIKETGGIASRFFHLVESFQSKLGEYTYWTRAWTFQEWARAFDVEVTLDTATGSSGTTPPVLQKAKSTIVYAAIMIADYKLRKGQYATMNLGWSRGYSKPKLDCVKRLFPFENVFSSPDEISIDEFRFQTLYPNEGTETLLGLRASPEQLRTAEDQFKVRLSLMLDSFAGMNKRKATFEADLVCCWASMCNIPYDYSKEDTISVAIAKVVRALRQRGITIYNFTASNGQQSDSQDVDLAFFEYAAAHTQTNATNQALFPAAPIFSGQADTWKHFTTLLTFCHKEKPEIPRSESGDVSVQAVHGAVIPLAVPLADVPRVLAALSSATSGGQGDNFSFTNPLFQIANLLMSLNSDAAIAALEASLLVLAAVPVSPDDPDGRYMHLWTICSRSAFAPGNGDCGTLFVGRESLNGTLVIAKKSATGPNIIAYLTISDVRSGTFVVPVSEEGHVDILLRTPIRSDMINSDYLPDRKLSATVRLIEYNDYAAESGNPGAHRAALVAYLGSVAEPENEALVRTIGNHRTMLGSIMRELAERGLAPVKKEWYYRGWPGLGTAAPQVDVGTMAIVPREKDVESERNEGQ